LSYKPKYMSRSTLYGSKEAAEKHIFPISAFYYFYIHKAIDNPQIFFGKTEEDKKLRKKLEEIIRRYYDVPNIEDLIAEFGGDDAYKHYRSPRQIFDEHKEELLNMTQVSKIRKMILDGPIQNANDIILTDIKEAYLTLIKEIQKISSEITSTRFKTIELSQTSNLVKRITVLEEKISKEKKYQKEQAKRLSNLLADMENYSTKAINKIKD